MGKPTDATRPIARDKRQQTKFPLAGRGRRRRRGRGAPGPAPQASAQCANANIRWDFTADVVVIGAGVAGLPAAITARDNGASVIIVDENYDIGGRGMLSGGRVQVGGGHALQQKLGIKDTADQIFADWVRLRPRREQVQRPRSGPRVCRRECRDLRLPDRQRRRVHREADPLAGCVDGRPHLRHQGMAHPEPGHRAAPEPQRLRPGAAARGKRAQEGRADLPQAQDDGDRAREAQCRPGARHHLHQRQQHGQHPGHARASSSRPAATPATSTSAASSIRG